MNGSQAEKKNLFPPAPRNSTPYEKVMRKVEEQGECLVFLGYRDKDGYGYVTRPNRIPSAAHRVVYEAIHGVIPKGKVIRHKCDNPPCVRIEHLEIGTHAQNSADMVQRGRSSRGELNPASRLTAEQVAEIRTLLSTDISQREIALRFGVVQTTISRIKLGYYWRAA